MNNDEPTLQGPQPSETRLALSKSYKARADRLESGIAKAVVKYETDDGNPAEAGRTLSAAVVALLPPALRVARNLGGLDELAEVLARLEYATEGDHHG